ncbi:MAG: hypothetical protein PHW74_09755 [Desulfobacca sp.]|nr:hypothetical protein [Desulfobacca sp.]
MTEEKIKVPGVDLDEGTISYDYIKSNQFRVIHVDGVWGGNAPTGFIHMSVFSERWPIPKRTVSQFEPEGKVGDEITERRVFRDSVVREVDAQLVMSIDVAIRIREWLKDKIANYEEGLQKRKNSERSLT